jgi:hypothetical protein
MPRWSKTLLRGHPVGQQSAGLVGAVNRARNIILRCIAGAPGPSRFSIDCAPGAALADTSCTILAPDLPTPRILMRPAHGTPCRQGLTRVREGKLKFRRNQVEEAIASVLEPGSAKPSSAMRTRMHRGAGLIPNGENYS